MKKLFLVLLEPAFIDATTSIRKPDGHFDATPYWLCSQVDMSLPHYLTVVPQAEGRDSTRPALACIHIPHHRVVGIVETTPEATPFGFGTGR